MDIVILPNSDALAAAGARRIQQQLRSKPDAVLGLATGATPLALYRQLIAGFKRGELSFHHVTSFNLDEYLGLLPTDKQSYRSTMRRELFDHIDIDPANTHLPECAAGESPLHVGPRYEAQIEAAGGIDLQILGIGQNGHVGFNEPSSSLRSRTRVKTLTRETIANNRHYFDTSRIQPELAITMGIATIMDAHEILLMASGAGKAQAVYESIEGPVSSLWPASALQMHEHVTVLLDEAAAALLQRQDYYKWVQDQKAKLMASIGSH